MMTKVKEMMMEPFKMTFSGRSRRGFSAVEILAVATIIAILSLILIPILRGRVSESRVTAARWEMNKLAQQATLAEADTGSWFRLQDLDNIDLFTPYSNLTYNPNLHVPSAVIQVTKVLGSAATVSVGKSGDLSEAQRQALSRNWSGPYISMPNNDTIFNLTNQYPLVFGPLPADSIVVNQDAPGVGSHNEGNGLYPLDPWGGPYFLFVETALGGNVIYSMGPDGIPASATGSPVVDGNYYPGIPGATNFPGGDAALGFGDDLTWKF